MKLTKKQRDKITEVLMWITMFMLIFAIVGFFVRIKQEQNKSTTYEFQISELEFGVYCYETKVVSSIPAHNYTLIVICDKNGNQKTIRGSLITYNYDGDPYVVWEHKNSINCDVVKIYIPPQTVKFMGVSTVR